MLLLLSTQEKYSLDPYFSTLISLLPRHPPTLPSSLIIFSSSSPFFSFLFFFPHLFPHTPNPLLLRSNKHITTTAAGRMGRLDFSCLTSTPDSSTFYGLDTTNSFDDLPNSYRTGYSFVIFKSNSNPTSPANLTWSVVSRISVKYLKSVGWGDYSCVVNADGVFTSFFRNYTASSLPVPSGFQYDPFGLPGSDTLIGEKGPGTWRPFKVDPSYQWLKPYGSSQLSQAIGYVSSPAGPYLLHCMLSESTIQFARQEETNGVLTLTKVGGWNLVRLILLFCFLTALLTFYVIVDNL